MLDSAAEEVVHTRGTPEFRDDKRRRIPGQPKKGFEATQMWDLYQEVARRIVLGQKNVEISNDLGITPQTVSYVRNSPIVQDKITKLHASSDLETTNIAHRIKMIAPQALDLLESLIITGKVGNEVVPAKVRADHAESMLDRAGYVPPREIRALNLHGHFTSDDIEKLKARALSGAIEAAIIVEDA